MIVAINCRNLTHHKMEGFGNYTYELVLRWIEWHPEVQFVLIFDRKPKVDLPEHSHVKKVIIGPPTRHPLLYWCWFEWSLPRVLKRENATVFFSPDGYNSLRSTVPSIITVHDINFEHYPKDLPCLLSRYLRFFFPKFVRKAKHVLTVSQFSRQDIIQAYACDPNKISFLYNGSNHQYRPLSPEQKVKVRDAISSGRPYFLFVGSLHPRKNVHRLIKAYLKLNQSDIDLIIVGSSMWDKQQFNLNEEQKSHVHFLGYLEKSELVDVMAAAFALTYVPYFEGFGIPLVEAMRCGTPILCSNNTCLPEVAGDAAIYCDPFDEEDILLGLQRLRDEPDLREELSQKGLQRGEEFSWDKTAQEAWKKIELIANT